MKDERTRVLLLAPSIWAVHFAACYTVAAASCEKAGHPARPAVAALTVAALVLLTAAALRGKKGGKAFLARAQVWLAALSGVGVAFAGAAAYFAGSCR